MSYTTKYTVPFISIKGVSYIVNIQQDGFNGSVTELTGASQPFSVDIDESNFMYAPLRFSKATLRIVTDDYLDDLFSTDPQKYRVLLEREGSVIWRGFIEPEIFTQDFSTTPVELEIGCVSAMSTLENIDFFKGGVSCAFISLWDLIKRCISSSNGGYENLIFPWVYSTSQGIYTHIVESGRVNVLGSITISEQNFFDEEGIPMKMSEVIEEICKFLGWTCVDFKGDLYIVDPDHSNRETINSVNKGKYAQYNIGANTYGEDLILPTSLNFQLIGFAGSENSIDKIPGFNKASVKTSNYPVVDIFPTEEFGTLALKYAQPDVISPDAQFKAVKKFLEPSAYKPCRYSPNASQALIGPMNSILPNELLGANLIKRTSYKISDNPTGYTLDEMIQVRLMSDWYGNPVLAQGKSILEFKEDLPVAAFSKGAISISCEVQVVIWNMDMNYFNIEDYTKNSGWDLLMTWYPWTNFSIPIEVMIDDKYLQSNGTWSTVYNTHALTFDVAKLKTGVFVPANSTKYLSDPYNSGKIIEGKLIAFPINDPICGKLSIRFLRPITDSTAPVTGFYMKKPVINYYILDNILDLVNKNTDRLYENTVNDSYMNPADEINLKISSWNNDELCYSKAILGTHFLTNNIYCVLSDSLIRPEEMLINRITGQYSSVKNKTTQIIKYSPQILPFCELSDDYFPDKKFLQIGGSIDYKNESYKVISIEKV